MPLTDAEVRALQHTDPEAWARAVDPVYASECAAAERAADPDPKLAPAPAPAVVTESRLMVFFRRFAANVAKVQVEREAGLRKRVAELEQRLAALESAAPDASLSTRLASVEVKLGAAVMLLAGKGVQPGKLSEVEELIGRVVALEARQGTRDEI